MSAEVMIILSLSILVIGYVIGVCREKYKWWKVFNCVEPEDFFIRKNIWMNTMDEEQLEAHYHNASVELKRSFWKSLITAIIVVTWIVLVVHLVW